MNNRSGEQKSEDLVFWKTSEVGSESFPHQNINKKTP